MAAGFNRRMRKTARPKVVWEAGWAQSQSADLIRSLLWSGRGGQRNCGQANPEEGPHDYLYAITALDGPAR